MKKSVLILIAAIGFGCADTMIEERILNPELPVVKNDWDGNLVVDGRFQNEPPSRSMGFRPVLKWRLGGNPQRREKRNDAFRLRTVAFDPAAMPANSIVWLGHSSFLIDVDGVRIVTDPAFYSLATMPRKAEMPCRPGELKDVNYLLISHDHRDHFGKKGVKTLAANNPGMEALVPLGGGRLFGGRKLRDVKVQEAGWYQEYRLAEGLRIVFLPAKHWCKRWLADTNKTLWGSFLIISQSRKIFFAGDTAYDQNMFREIRETFGDIDICLLPIGAYAPRWFMAGSHIDPQEAARVFGDLGGKTFVPMHYGTYDLSDEPPGEPIKLLRRYVGPEQLKELVPGEVWLFL